MEMCACRQCPTRRYCLGAELEPEALEALSTCVHVSSPLQRGSQLYRAGDAVTDCYVVRSGSFKTSVTSIDGEEHVTGFHFPGDLPGLAGLATGRHVDDATALETSTACRVPLETVPHLWQLGSGSALLHMIGRGAAVGVEAHANLSRHAADARVAGFLLGLRDRLSKQGRTADYLPLPMSRSDLANHLGMTLESLSRVLSRLRREGTLSVSRRSVTCRDYQRLTALAGHVAD